MLQSCQSLGVEASEKFSLSRQSWNDALTTSWRVMTGAEKRGWIDESMSRRDKNMDCSYLSGALNSM